MTIFPRPSEWARIGNQHAAATPFAGGEQHYFAFLSYSHRDSAMASWLHDALEKYRTPMHLVGRVTDQGSVPRRLTPIFRDLGELPASADLNHEIKSALAASRFLIVLCSPEAAKSRWTNAEIEAFKRVRPDGCVFAVIVAGEPFASDIPGREAEECLPRALRFKYDRRGRPTAKRAEPLAADLREPGEVRRLGFLKLVAGMLGVGLDDLVRREAVRRHRHMAAIAGASLIGMLVASALALAAFQGRNEARDQRREAESLVAFMLGDLKDKLEPIGRLDALDSVGAKVLAYYEQQDTSDLSDAALMQRSRALTLMAGVANSRGDLEGAMRLYREAMAGTAEAIRRNPQDPQRLFDHAQNVYWTGAIALSRGDLESAEAAYRDYNSLAGRMVALDPDNMKWRMETQYADANLGIVLYEKRQFAEAASHFERALATIRALATADPSNGEYQKGVAEALAWLAQSHMARGAIHEAITLRNDHVALLGRLLRSSGGDVKYREKLVPAYRGLGNAHAALGQFLEAEAALRSAVDHAERLTGVERDNMLWAQYAASARLDLADTLLHAGKVHDASGAARSACSMVDGLLSRNPTMIDFRTARRNCLSLRSEIALAAGERQQALALAKQALQAARSISTSDRASDAFAVAKASRILGDALQALGDREAARAAWQFGLSRIPPGITRRPAEMSEHAKLLQRADRRADAQALQAQLNAMGYRRS